MIDDYQRCIAAKFLPGTGKTFRGTRFILKILCSRKRVLVITPFISLSKTFEYDLKQELEYFQSIYNYRKNIELLKEYKLRLIASTYHNKKLKVFHNKNFKGKKYVRQSDFDIEEIKQIIEVLKTTISEFKYKCPDDENLIVDYEIQKTKIINYKDDKDLSDESYKIVIIQQQSLYRIPNQNFQLVYMDEISSLRRAWAQPTHGYNQKNWIKMVKFLLIL